MAQPTPPKAGICLHCGGFPAVAITLGGRNRRGHLRTLTAHCPVCHGTGHALTDRRTVTA
ncbi:hypothetical protein ACIQUQ_06030 [Streptomyces sp. NPDC101118]|uniref:hypothetical protein n=1 Tax=Streptomyces sp. NPDC101118 TaxID=3366109 RepID=UPI00380657DB